MMKRFRVLAFVVCLFVLSTLCFSMAYAETAQDITSSCKFTGRSKFKNSRLYDKKYTSYWTSHEMVEPSIQIEVPAGKRAAYLYICFAQMPKSWAIETYDGNAWQLFLNGSTQYMHAFVELGDQQHFRLVETSGKKSELSLNELFVFTAGDVPDWVQRWSPTPEKADLLLLVAHPDDELLFFGGTISTYAAEQMKNVIVAYMSYGNTTRRSELLNGLWHMGLRTYPVIGDFHDLYAKNLEAAYKLWPKDDARDFVMEIVRKYKPEVMLTHDVNGEYGHGAHRLCADVAQYCAENSASSASYTASALSHGTWQMKKLYLHLYGENQLTMDWRVPLASMDGKTGLELAKEAYKMHVTQQSTSFSVSDKGKHSCSAFGLAYSQVGDDVLKNDFFEHIE